MIWIYLISVLVIFVFQFFREYKIWCLGWNWSLAKYLLKTNWRKFAFRAAHSWVYVLFEVLYWYFVR